MTQTQYSQIEVDDTYYERGLRAIRLGEKKIMEDVNIKKLGYELEDSYEPTVDYCFNLEGVILLSSNALGQLRDFNDKYKRDRGKNIKMVNVGPRVRRTLTVTRLDQTEFDIRNTIEDCLEN